MQSAQALGGRAADAEIKPDGTVEALFRYEGSTCTNMGRAIQFHYHVKLGPRADGIRFASSAAPRRPGDTGHTYMCRYMNNAEHLMVAIEQEKAADRPAAQ
jgi:hypothetical protein